MQKSSEFRFEAHPKASADGAVNYEALRKISQLVALHVMRECFHNWKRIHPGLNVYECDKCGKRTASLLFRVGTDADYALDPAYIVSIEDRLLQDGWSITYEVTAERQYRVMLAKEGQVFQYTSDTRLLALCLCALTAYGVDVQEVL